MTDSVSGCVYIWNCGGSFHQPCGQIDCAYNCDVSFAQHILLAIGYIAGEFFYVPAEWGIARDLGTEVQGQSRGRDRN